MKSNKQTGSIKLKKVYRTIEKSALCSGDEQYDYTGICDIARGTLMYDNISGVLKCVIAILSENGVEVLRFKNRFLEPTHCLVKCTARLSSTSMLRDCCRKSELYS